MSTRIFMLVCPEPRFDVGRCSMYVYIFSGLRYDGGRCPWNVCMPDVFVIFACICIFMFPDFDPMSSGAQGMIVCFLDFGPMSDGAR